MIDVIKKFDRCDKNNHLGTNHFSEERESLFMEYAKTFLEQNGTAADQKKINKLRYSILDTKLVMENGKHDIVYYPFCGEYLDAMRVFISSSPKELIIADSRLNMMNLAHFCRRNFAPNGGLELDLKDRENEETLTFDFEGEKRKIIAIKKDPRLVNREEIMKVDVLYIFTEKFSDRSIAEDLQMDSNLTVNQVNEIMHEDENLIMNKRYSQSLCQEYLDNVNVGGFIVLNEKKINGMSQLSRIMLDVVGLEEKRILPRINSNAFSKDYNQNQNLAYVYKKTREVRPKAIFSFNLICTLLKNIENDSLSFFETRKDEFNYCLYELQQIGKNMKDGGEIELADIFVSDVQIKILSLFKKKFDKLDKDEYANFLKEVLIDVE